MLIVAACAISAQGQSGRRQPKAPPAAPVPTPTPEPTPEPKKEKPSELGFIIAAHKFSTFESYPWSYYDAAMRGCAEKLRSGSSADVNVVENDMNRGEAIKKAKAETTTYVVLLTLILDQMTAQSYNDLELDYVVFAPKTGKVVTTGRTYLNVNRRGPLVVGPTRRGATGVMMREQLVRYAGEDAGERILKAMNLNTPAIKSTAN
ncbi:MAG TPA: hypothetical protein VK893_15240 [Pyrinomonadaceae bacterium]|nr:hypothetical protein [Pyrinomonadaceae bacterium]